MATTATPVTLKIVNMPPDAYAASAVAGKGDTMILASITPGASYPEGGMVCDFSTDLTTVIAGWEAAHNSVPRKAGISLDATKSGSLCKLVISTKSVTMTTGTNCSATSFLMWIVGKGPNATSLT